MDEKTALYELIDGELAWLAGFQLPDGALPMTPFDQGGPAWGEEDGGERTVRSKICPYFSEFAALALLLRPAQYGENVRRYLDWHFAHLNTAEEDYNSVDGTIYDYEAVRLPDGTIEESILTDPRTGTLSYDSTDSYAGLFLELLWKYAEKTGDGDYVRRHWTEIERIYGAMLSTLDRDLTWAKPDYRVKYLMDNCEVCRGLRAMRQLVRRLFLPSAAEEQARERMLFLLRDTEEREAALLRRIERCLWKEEAAHYLVGLMDDDAPLPEHFDWNTFYPDALAQLFPVLMEVLPADSPRAVALYETFSRHFSGGEAAWEELRGERLGEHNINGLIPYTAARMGDFARLRRYFSRYRTLYAETGHPSPAYNADCAQVAMAAAIMAENADRLQA